MSKRDKKRLANNSQWRLRLHFLGAAGTVTGSLHFFEFTEAGKTVRFFVDAGLNQQDDSVNYRNRLPAGIQASDIDFGIFSHAHIDHVGYLPKLMKEGFKGPVYASKPTCDLLGILLPDSGHIQEEEADERNRRQRKRLAQNKDKNAKGTGKNLQPRKFEPLYTAAQAREALKLLRGVDFNVKFEPAPSVVVRLSRASHLLGAGVVSMEIGSGGKKRRVVFSGDLGRPGMPIIRDLEAVSKADYLICESTYGTRLHPKRDRLKELADVVNRAYERAKKPQSPHGHGVILMPAFAVGRIQGVLYDLRQLMQEKRIPNIPVFVDSPMANLATAVYRKHPSEYNVATANAAKKGDPFSTPQYAEVMSTDQSKLLDEPAAKPIIILSASGMAVAGRIVFHLKERLSVSNNTVVFLGFQANGTLGHQIVSEQEKIVRIGGQYVQKRAAVEYLQDYSGHADYADILRWLKGFTPKPKKLFLVHGDDESLAGLKEKVEKQLRWDVTVPRCKDFVDLE
ncbi:MAG: MBL fold metallo-hydrolase [Candidatus Obscuribacterales bacterium]|nr:MBL fold metallo-hydrolase [Candidatus Obscuribacterales bacterium]